MKKIFFVTVLMIMSLISYSKEIVYDIAVSIYHPVAAQCDSRPLETASGDWIDTTRTTELRWVAISRNLHKRWGGEFRFGDTITITGTGNPKTDGDYVVKDIMNKMYTDKVDILVDKKSGIYNHWKHLKMKKKVKKAVKKTYKKVIKIAKIFNFNSKTVIKTDGTKVNKSLIKIKINGKKILFKKIVTLLQDSRLIVYNQTERTYGNRNKKRSRLQKSFDSWNRVDNDPSSKICRKG